MAMSMLCYTAKLESFKHCQGFVIERSFTYPPAASALLSLVPETQADELLFVQRRTESVNANLTRRDNSRYYSDIDNQSSVIWKMQIDWDKVDIAVEGTVDI